MPSKRLAVGCDAVPEQTELKHATAVALGDAAAIIVGPSGSGKSDFALRCLAMAPNPICARSFKLVSDDQTQLSIVDGRLIATCPPTIAGKIEVRGIGIVEVNWCDNLEVALIVNLTQRHVLRLPAEEERERLLGISVRCISLNPWEVSAPLKLALALQDIVAKR